MNDHLNNLPNPLAGLKALPCKQLKLKWAIIFVMTFCIQSTWPSWLTHSYPQESRLFTCTCLSINTSLRYTPAGAHILAHSTIIINLLYFIRSPPYNGNKEHGSLIGHIATKRCFTVGSLPWVQISFISNWFCIKYFPRKKLYATGQYRTFNPVVTAQFSNAAD